MSETQTPAPVFEGIENFRDFGGYQASGGRLRRNLLYRSAHHARATEKDLNTLGGLGLATFVDLRRPHERERDPNRQWPGFEAEVITNDLDASGNDNLAHFVSGADADPGSVRRYMLEFYQEAAFLDRHKALFSAYLKAIAQARGPILVHCAAGKDRTGIICALTQHIAGVSDDDIMAEYLLTNDEARFARLAPLIARRASEATGKVVSEQAARIAMAVHPEYLVTTLDLMREMYGSIDGYIETALGVDARTRDEICRHAVA